MSLSASTAAQRAELVAAANMLAKYCHEFNESGYLDTDNTALIAALQVYITRMQAALVAIGASGTTAFVSNAQQLTGVVPSGTYASKVTFTVANGAITAIALS